MGLPCNPAVAQNPRWKDWLKQAENELLWAEDALSRDQFALSCFLCQQAAEMALKSLGYFRGADMVKGHSITAIADALSINGPVREAALRLDQYYITTRYPDSHFTGAAFEYFTHDQAAEAIEFAKRIFQRIHEETKT